MAASAPGASRSAIEGIVTIEKFYNFHEPTHSLFLRGATGKLPNATIWPRLWRACLASENRAIVRDVTAEFHHNVYVILLDPRAATHRSVLRANPRRDPAKPCVYVGMSGLPPEHRFENHKHGYKAAWVTKKYGVRLLPELYEHLNPMPYEAAQQMEIDLAEDLRREGYTVTGGH